MKCNECLLAKNRNTENEYSDCKIADDFEGMDSCPELEACKVGLILKACHKQRDRAIRAENKNAQAGRKIYELTTRAVQAEAELTWDTFIWADGYVERIETKGFDYWHVIKEFRADRRKERQRSFSRLDYYRTPPELETATFKRINFPDGTRVYREVER